MKFEIYMYYVAMQSNSSTVGLALQKENYLTFNGIPTYI